MDEAFRFNPSWIFDPAVWRIIEQADKNAAARLQFSWLATRWPRR